MKWKEIYSKCNSKKFSAITDIRQPITLKSTFSIFLDKYKLPLLIGVIALSISSIFIYKFSIKVFLSIIAVLAMIVLALIYYNTYKLEFKNDYLNLNIMFRNIKLRQGDLANIYLEKQDTNLFLIIPFSIYSINIIYSDNGIIRGYSLSTIMVKKEDVLKFFKHFDFQPLKLQKEQDKKDDIYDGIRRIITFFIGIVLLIAVLLYIFH